jgi:hypothetical protein
MPPTVKSGRADESATRLTGAGFVRLWWFDSSRARCALDCWVDSDLMATDIRGMLRFFATQFAATNDPIGQSLALIIGAIDVLTVVPDDRSPEADTRIESGVVFLQEARRKSGSQQDAERFRRDVEEAQREFIRALEWQKSHAETIRRRARTMIWIAMTCGLLDDIDGVRVWLNEAASTLEIEPGDRAALVDELKKELPGMTQEPELGSRALLLTAQSPPRSLGGMAIDWLEDRGWISYEEKEPMVVDPRSDVIGWG